MPSDLELLHEYAIGRDAAAFSAILQRHQDLVYGTCLRILQNRSDAEDAVQECFLKLARQAESVRTSLAGWLHSCATNICLSELRQTQARQKRERVYGNGKAALAEPPEATWEQIAPAVDRALEDLPGDVRHLLIECFLRQRSQTEVAKEVGVSRATLGRRLAAGVEMLRDRLRKAGVVAGAGLLAALLEKNAAVAAPAELVYQLGKIALAGVGGTAGPGSAPIAAAPVHIVGGTSASASALKAAGVAAAAILAVGLGALVGWFIFGGGVRSSPEGLVVSGVPRQEESVSPGAVPEGVGGLDGARRGPDNAADSPGRRGDPGRLSGAGAGSGRAGTGAGGADQADAAGAVGRTGGAGADEPNEPATGASRGGMRSEAVAGSDPRRGRIVGALPKVTWIYTRDKGMCLGTQAGTGGYALLTHDEQKMIAEEVSRASYASPRANGPARPTEPSGRR